MEQSIHEFVDKNGYRSAVEIIDETNDLVVFDSIPKLMFDFKSHRFKIKKSKYYDYTVIYKLKNDRLFLSAIQTYPGVFSRNKPLLGVYPEWFDSKKWANYAIGDLFVSYTGKLKVGKDFDMKFWEHDDKAYPVPFAPEVYKQNGYAVFENGRMIDLHLD